MENSEWCVAVFKCKPDKVKNVLVDFYEFVKDLRCVESLHFLIRDRVDDDVVFSFRILVKAEEKKTAKSKIRYKLKTLLTEDKFAINPNAKNPLQKYVAWSTEVGIKRHGREKFNLFCDFLSRLSRLVVNMAKIGYFSSTERVETAHVMSWMLGCTEYSILTPVHMEMGYYDRIEDRYQPYQKKSLAE